MDLAGRTIAVVAAVGTSLAGTLALGLASPATARATTVVDGSRFAAAGLEQARLDCNAPELGTTGRAELHHVIGNGAPLGVRAARYDLGDATGGVGPLAAVDDPTTITSLRLSVRPQSTPYAVAAVARYRAEGAGTTWWGVTTFAPDHETAWRTVEAAERAFEWTELDADGEQVGDAGVQTLDSFFSTRTAPGSHEVGFLVGCSGGDALLDGLGVSDGSGDRVWDFEGGSTSADLSLSTRRATYGGKVVARTKVATQQDGEQLVILERRRRDASPVQVKGEFVDQGRDTFRFKAKVSGQYRIRVPDSDDNDGSTSPWRALSVPSKVTASPSTRSLRQGSRFTVAGAISPSASGTVVVERRAGGRWVRAASDRWSGKGYTVSVKATATGQQTYRVRSPRTDRNDAATSRSFTVSVTAPPSSGGGSGSTGGGGTGGGSGGGGAGGGGEDPPQGPQRPVS